MKRTLITLLLVAMLTSSTLVIAQSVPNRSVIHEDIVKPSMDAKYRELLQKLQAACVQHKITFGWTTLIFDDNSYRHIAPINGFADLEKNPFADLEAKMGKEAFTKLMGDFDACIESHSDFVMMPLTELSYLSPGLDDNSRRVTFWHPLPGKDAEAESILSEWKKLSEAKKIPGGFLVFKVIFGELESYTVVHWGKNEADETAKHQKSLELLGEEGTKLWLKTQAITKKIYTKRAELARQFSYTAAK